MREREREREREIKSKNSYKKDVTEGKISFRV